MNGKQAAHMIGAACSIDSLLAEQPSEFSVPLSFQFLHGHKAQGRRIDAVAQAARLLWAIGEDVPEVGIGPRRANFGAGVADLVVGVFGQGLAGNRPRKRRPAAARVVLVETAEQGFPDTTST